VAWDEGGGEMELAVAAMVLWVPLGAWLSLPAEVGGWSILYLQASSTGQGGLLC